MTEIKKNCPDKSTLSEFVDMERSGVELKGEWKVVSEHIRECPECGKIVAGYRRITDCLDRLSIPPPDLSDRILSACRRPGIGERIRPFPIWRRAEVWRRIGYGCAACLALFLGVTVFYHSGTDELSAEDSPSPAMVAQADTAPSAVVADAAPLVAKAKPAPSAVVADAAPLVAKAKPAPSAAVADAAPLVAKAKPAPAAAVAELASSVEVAEVEAEASQGMTIGLSDSALSFSTDMSRLHGSVGAGNVVEVGRLKSSQASSARQNGGFQLRDNIKHVWSFDDMEQALTELGRLEASGKCRLEREGDRITALFEGIVDRDLQAMVDRFGKLKWALVSPFLPQPQEGKQVEFTGKRVNYLLVGVKKEK